MAYIWAMLNQDVSFFDTDATSGEVVSEITNDIIIVQDAISEKGAYMPLLRPIS